MIPAWVLGAAGTVGQIVVGMLSKLLTERFVKSLVIRLLEEVVKRTETEADDQLLRDAKKEWECQD